MLIRASSNSGQLYGSVNVRDIVDGAGTKRATTIDKQHGHAGRPIKTIGMFDVTRRAAPRSPVTVKANVARSDDEAELQARAST